MKSVFLVYPELTYFPLTIDCEPGYWCLIGSKTATPELGYTLYDVCQENATEDQSMLAGICPTGKLHCSAVLREL